MIIWVTHDLHTVFNKHLCVMSSLHTSCVEMNVLSLSTLYMCWNSTCVIFNTSPQSVWTFFSLKEHIFWALWETWCKHIFSIVVFITDHFLTPILSITFIFLCSGTFYAPVYGANVFNLVKIEVRDLSLLAY